MQLAYYNGLVFQSRVSVPVGQSKVVPQGTTSLRVAFLYPSSLGIDMTQSTINDYFAAGIYRKQITNVEYDSKVYDLESAINKSTYGYHAISPQEFIVGNLDADGEIATKKQRVCTPQYMKINYNAKIEADSDYRVVLCTYDNSYNKIDLKTNTGGTILVIPENTFFRICVYKVTEEDVTDIIPYAAAVMYETNIQGKIDEIGDELDNCDNEIDQLHTAIEKAAYGYSMFDESQFEKGNLYSHGEYVANSKRVYTPEFMKIPYNAALVGEQSYRVVLCTYSAASESAFLERKVNTGGTQLIIPADTYFRIAVYKATEETVTDIAPYAAAVSYETEIASKINAIDVQADYDFLRCFHKFCGIGDSLMAGFTQINNITENSTKGVETGNNWFQYLMTRLGREGHNLAIGSSTTHNWRYGSQSGYPSTNLNGADIDGVDCYFVGLGVNDMIHPTENTIGTSADIKSDYTQNADSTYGNLDYIFHKLAEFNPYAKVFVFTVPWYGNYDPTDVNAAIRHVCSVNDNAFCIDLAENNPVSDNAFIQANFTGNHFNPLVYNLFSKIIEERVNAYIYENYTHFVWIPYEH